MNFQIFNTYTRQKEKIKPLRDGLVKMYTCGPTVYNYAHIGNFRAYIFEDILRRSLEYWGFKVIQVMNLTDVDDKTIRDSKAAGIPLCKYTQKFKDAFFEDMKKLNIEKAEFYPAATDHVREMIDMIKILIDKGFAYRSDDGSIYFSIKKFPNYGKLAKIDMDNQRSGVRVSTDEYEKDSVADFALWKTWTEADGDVWWDSPWGKGRPGWHIECSAMSMKYLGKTFDIHTGGIDNMFPHHEDEIAQSEAANGFRFVNYWMHCEYLLVNGEKMSKSLGNFYTLRDLLDKGYAWNEIRWVLVATHYRRKLNFTLDSCLQARETLKSFKDFFLRLDEIIKSRKAGANPHSVIHQNTQKFREAIADDLNISEALAAVFNLQKEVNKMISAGELGSEGATAVLSAYDNFDNVLGVFNIEDYESSGSVPAEVIKLVEERQAARKAKDFKKADEIRDKLKQQGWELEDTSGGARVKRI